MCCLQIKLNLTNQTDKELGPFEVNLSQNGSYGERVVTISGLQSMVIPLSGCSVLDCQPLFFPGTWCPFIKIYDLEYDIVIVHNSSA